MLINPLTEKRARLLLRPSYGVSYIQSFSNSPSEHRLPQKNKSEGELSRKSIIRMKTAIEWMRLLSDKKFVWNTEKQRGFWFRLNFITLTLSDLQCFSDEEILNQLLKPFLQWMRREKNVIHYVWRCEVQEERLAEKKQRCIHFHIISNKFIHHKAIRAKWNYLQWKMGIIEAEEEPPSTEIRSVINEGKIVSYCAKYMSKSTSNPELRVYCKIWGCNHELSNLKAVIREEDHYHFWNHLLWYKRNFAKKEETKPYITLYHHKLKRGGRMSGIIERELMRCYEQFQVGDDNIRKYRI